MRKSPVTISVVGVFLIAFLAVAQAQNTITTIAGGGPTGVSAKSAGIGSPWSVVQDSKGNTYISDNLSNRVFKVNTSGTITVAAGNIVASYNANNRGDGNLATTASLSSPESIALDSSGNLYIADTSNNAIRVVNTQSSSINLLGGVIPAGVIETIAGDGSGTQCSPTTGPCGDGGPSTSATLNAPGGVWLDADGNVYIADSGDSRVRVVNMQATPITFYGSVTIQPGDIQTIAGTGTAGFNNDGPALTQQINLPNGLYVTGSANAGTVLIYLADTINNRVRVVNGHAASFKVANVSIPSGNIATVAGTGTEGYSGDTGPAISAKLNHPSGVVADNLGNVYIADGDNVPPPQTIVTSNEVIRKVTGGGTITTFAGTNGTPCSRNILPCGDGATATSANLWAPTGVFVTGSDNLLIADQNDDAIRQVSSGNIQTLMGALLNTAYAPFPVTITGVATIAGLREPAGVASDAAGNVYIADTFNDTIRIVNRSGTISTLVGNGYPCVSATCGDGGPANQATLYIPFDVVFDSAGNMYIADSGDNTIRVVNNQASNITIAGQTIAPGHIGTVAGDYTACATAPCGDAGAATEAQLNSPQGLALDNANNIYIADTKDNAIRVVNPNTTGSITIAGVSITHGQIMTVAGAANPTTACTNPLSGNCGDGSSATSALLNAPGGVGVDIHRNIYISDTGDSRVRIVDHATFDINPFAGTGTPCSTSCGNGGLAVNALLDMPQGLFLDLAGDVFIADALDYEVREVTPNLKIQGVAGNETRGFSGDGGSATAAQLAVPVGISGDPFGELLIADATEWRVRKVTSLVVTQPRADLSPSPLAFSDQPILTTSPARTITLSNDSFGNPLAITNDGVLSGTNVSDFKIVSNSCTGSLAAGSSCAIDITFSPPVKGNLVATLTITDNAGGVAGTQQTVAISGNGLPAVGLGEQVDYFGEGKADFTVWRPSTAVFYTLDQSNKELTSHLGVSTDIPIVGDFDGDGKTDFGVWRPSNGTWYIIQSSNGKEITRAWGAEGDIPVPGDYDGDGKTDFAVFRPSNGTWYILTSGTLQETIRPWGMKGDVPVPGDYNGDGKTDFAVWRPSNGTWYILISSTLQEIIRPWGANGDIPVPGDYDGDGKTDFAVWRPSNGTWYVLDIASLEEVIHAWGVKGDIPVARDYDGDGKADFAVWRPSDRTWYITRSTNGTTFGKAWGASTDIPMNRPIGQ